jgi:segregation and condensation protein B
MKMDDTHLDNVVLSLLFASDEPLSAKKISNILDDVDTGEIRRSMERLGGRIRTDTPSIVLEAVAGGWQLSTNPEYAEFIARLYSGRRKQRLSKAALETVAIIAYKQPVTRADIENIRGVSCGGVITTLMERSLIRIVGKAKVLGAPFLYGTTHEFLEYLGINSLKDLPSMEELETLLEQEEATQAPVEAEQADEADASATGSASIEEFEDTATGQSQEDVEKVDEEDHEWKAHSTTNEEPQIEDDPDRVQLDK